MDAKCPRCGYRAGLLTETSFYTCSQCSAGFRVYGGMGISEEYFRHAPDQRTAWGSLLSHLDANACLSPSKAEEIVFRYHPFWFADLDDGSTAFKPATPLPEGFTAPLIPPAGDLEFSQKEMSLPAASQPPSAVFGDVGRIQRLRLLHIPLYLIAFRVAGLDYRTAVSGCGWQVHATQLPPEAGIDIPAHRLVFIGIYLALLVGAGLAAPNLWWRSGAMAVILLVAWGLERAKAGGD